VLNAPLSNPDGFISSDNVSLELSRIGLFGRKRVSLHLEKPMWQAVFHLKTNLVLTVKQFARCSYFSNNGFLSRAI
jgi:hypothetical protein